MEQTDGWFYVVYARVVVYDIAVWRRVDEFRERQTAVHTAALRGVHAGSFQWLVRLQWVCQHEETLGGA